MINLGFWEKLKKPILCLAPMADVTDCAFRQIIAKYGKPDIFFTEFVSADGLSSAGKDKLLIDFIYSENERPIVAQIFGGKPENIKNVSALCKELGFDGIDINMGCPDKSVEKQCAGAAMMRDAKLAREIIRSAREGGGGLPISVKTRIGYNKNEIETWIRELLQENLSALTVHLRTRKEMSNVPAHWDLMKRIVEIRDETKVETLILGNGDVMNLEEAKQKIKETGCDGVMLGRAIFGNPWLFASKEYVSKSTKDKLKVMLEHTKLFEKMLGKHKNFAIMKKHFKAYVNGFDGAKELRMKLMETENASQVEKIINDFAGNI
ncbi:MAG TPA: tRNA-dihydrouridine synthase [Candidatus Paceibacterota bacterium]|jgi:nifR3 family TIM-barrel protein|nr:tRNA-dihydrouridine synthase [Candidatus Paceibacterota bacterium]